MKVKADETRIHGGFRYEMMEHASECVFWPVRKMQGTSWLMFIQL